MLRFKKIGETFDETLGRLAGFEESDRYIIGIRPDGRLVIIDIDEAGGVYVEELKSAVARNKGEEKP